MLRVTRFESGALPRRVTFALADQLRSAHARHPFSPLDPREATRRVRCLLEGMDVAVAVYRGEVDLRGAGIDHVWLAVDGRVVDAAFPLFATEFVETLRGYVAGDRTGDQLVSLAVTAGVERRVLGRFPPTIRYQGAPLWSAR